MTANDELSADERETLALVDALIRTGNLRPVIARLHEARDGRERARDALTVLGELDLDVLVQLALDALDHESVNFAGRTLKPQH